MKTGLIILLSVVSLLMLQNANAQDCTPQILAQKPGEWKKSPDFSPNISGEILSKAKTVVTPLSKLFLKCIRNPKAA